MNEVIEVMAIVIIFTLLTVPATGGFSNRHIADNVATALCQLAEQYQIDGGDVVTMTVEDLMARYPALKELRIPGGGTVADWFTFDKRYLNTSGTLETENLRVVYFYTKNDADHLWADEGKARKIWVCGSQVPLPNGRIVTADELISQPWTELAP